MVMDCRCAKNAVILMKNLCHGIVVRDVGMICGVGWLGMGDEATTRPGVVPGRENAITTGPI